MDLSLSIWSVDLVLVSKELTWMWSNWGLIQGWRWLLHSTLVVGAWGWRTCLGDDLRSLSWRWRSLEEALGI